MPPKISAISNKIHLAEAELTKLAREQAVHGRVLLFDNSVAAFIGSRVGRGSRDIKQAVRTHILDTLAETIARQESAGKRVATVKLSVVEDQIQIKTE